MVQGGDVLTHAEMCFAEGGKYLQKGMHFKPHPKISVFLMSRRVNAPYPDRIEEDGRVLIYEGHDIRPDPKVPDPKSVDQPLRLPNGKPADNGKFYDAAQAAKNGGSFHRVHVYEKLRTNLWVFNGEFLLEDAWVENDRVRNTCKFKLRLVEGEDESIGEIAHTRLIPPEVKVEVWKRDGGKCVECGSDKNLHFDHIIPFSKGGTSLVAENIQLLCAKHNLAKSDRIG